MVDESKIEQLKAAADLITQKELSVLLQVTTNTLREWRRLGKGPDYVRVQKGVFYRMRDIQIWLEHNTVQTART